MTEIVTPFAQFFDTNGAPLNNGAIFIGTAYLDAQTNPIPVYWDDALTIPALQPIRTLNGYAVWNGAPARIFCNADNFSMTVQTSTGRTVWAVQDATSVNIPSISGPDGSSQVGFIQDGAGAVARTAQAKMRDFINVRDFGAVGNGGADDTAAIQAAVNASNGNTIHFPSGQYRLTAPITASQSISVLGVGNGAGPGGAEQSNSQVTQFMLDYANPSAFVVTNTNKPCLFRDFQINVNPAWRTAGAGRGISISAVAGTGTNANTKIENVAFNWLHTPIYAYKPSWWTIEGCYFGNWTSDAIFSETQAGTEGSLGWVRRNFFFGDPTASQRSCIYLRNGYTIISENEILGTQYGIQVDVTNHPAGFIKIINNTIEEQYYAGVYFSATDANDATMLDISGNEFSSVSTAATYFGSIWIGDGPARQWLQDVTIKNNITRNLGVCSLGHIRVGAGANVMVSGNMLENIGGSAVANGININGTASNAALAAQIAVLDNMFRGSFTNRYSFFALGGTGVILRDPVAMTVAQIPVNTADGSEIYASNGRSTALGNYTLIAGGMGAKAFRQRGQWLTPGDLL
jgi:hypothetical protein